jgi:O-antigen/teichoic acid export membrane protein
MKVSSSRFSINVTWSVVYVAVNAIVGLLLTRITLDHIGMELFGVWTMMILVLVLGVMGDQVFGAPVIHLVSKSKSLNAEEDTAAVVSTSLFALVAVTAVIIPLFHSFSSWSAQVLIPEYATEFGSLFSFLGPVLSIGILSSGCLATITALGRNDHVFQVRSIARILQLFVCWMLLDHGWTLSALIAGLFLHNLILLVFGLVLVLRLVPIRFGLFEISCLRRILQIGSRAVGSRILQMAMDPLFKSNIARSLGYEAVGQFEVSQKVNGTLSALPVSMFSNIAPAVMELTEGRDCVTKNLAAFRTKVQRKYLAIGSSGYGLAFFLIPDILEIFLGGNFNGVTVIITRLLILTYFIHSLAMIDLNICIGFGRANCLLISSAFTFALLVIGFILVGSLEAVGILGAVAVYCCSVIGGALAIFVYFHSIPKEG